MKYKKRINLKLFLILSIFFSAAFRLQGAQIFTKTVIFSNGKAQVRTNGYLSKRPKVALVLSGGGSHGMVHIGVLKALEEERLPIDLIVGTSIGSVIGGLYASGYSTDQLAEIMKNIDWGAIYRDETQRTALYAGQKKEQDRYLVTIRFNKGNPFIPVAVSPGQKILGILSDLILKAHYQARNNYDNLRIPFRSVATDLVSGKLVILKSGNLAESINASLAIPLLFTPIVRDSMLLLDGGMRSNLPVNAARQSGADIVLAVDVTSGLRKKEQISAPWEIVDQATTIMTADSKKRESLAADLLLKPDLDHILNDDFSKTDSLIALGEAEAEKIIPALKAKIEQRDSTKEISVIPAQVEFITEQGSAAAEKNKLQIKAGRSVFLKDILREMDRLMESGSYEQVVAGVDSAHISFKVYKFAGLKKINLLGNTRYPAGELKSLFISKAGSPLNSKVLQNDLVRLIKKYRSNGYSLMKIDSLSWDERQGLLTIVINEGRISDFTIIGNEKTKNYVILREFSSQKGRVFNWKKVREAILNVYASQLYERVSVDIVERDHGNCLVIKVKEKPSVILRLGAKYDTDRLTQAYVELGDESLFGTGIKTLLVFRAGANDKYLGIKIRDDRIFTTYLTFNLQTYLQRQLNPYRGWNDEQGRYREERRGVRFQVGQQMKRLGQVIFELRQEYIKDRREEGEFSQAGDLDLRTFALRAITDKRDFRDFPTRGIFNHWAWESGNRLVLETKDSYTKAQVNIEGYFTFYRRHTWHLKLFAGIGDKSMPFSENFRLGGLHNFYGLYENEFHGRQLVLSSVAYRYKIPWYLNKKSYLLKNIYFSLRYDFAGLWKDPDLVFTGKDFFSGYGAYIGLQTTLGPLYFAYGRRDNGESRFYFSLGLSY